MTERETEQVEDKNFNGKLKPYLINNSRCFLNTLYDR